MSAPYRIRLVQNKGLEYIDEGGSYRFDLYHSRRVFNLSVPGGRWDAAGRHPMTVEESERIVPLIVEYLKNVKWFGFIPANSDVRLREAIEH